MLEVKDAYKLLGVREGAGRDEIEKRFAVLLKKHRMSIKEGSENASEVNMEEIINAYNFLMGYEVKGAEEQEVDRKPNPLLQKIGVDEKKARNFFYYYKFHIVIGVIVLIVLVTTLRGCLTRVAPDLNIAFVGEFFYSDTDGFETAIENKLPEVKEVGIDGAILSEKLDGQQEYAMQMKAVVIFAGGDTDVFILDRPNFEKYAGMGAFMSLDELVQDLGIDRNKNRSNVLKAEEEQVEHLYGIDVSSSPLFDKGGIAGKERIAAVNVRAKHYRNAVRLINILLEQ